MRWSESRALHHGSIGAPQPVGLPSQHAASWGVTRANRQKPSPNGPRATTTRATKTKAGQRSRLRRPHSPTRELNSLSWWSSRGASSVPSATGRPAKEMVPAVRWWLPPTSLRTSGKPRLRTCTSRTSSAPEAARCRSSTCCLTSSCAASSFESARRAVADARYGARDSAPARR